jgi:regulator of nonsense transcripts 1
MKMGRLLVCAPSNSATDLLTEKISKFNLEMVRVFSTEGKRKTEGSAIEKFGLHKIIFKRCEKLRKLKQEYDDFEDSNEEEFKELKRKIELQVLRDADVVLTTCVLSGSKLIKSVNFDRVIIDEAGQASEPETLITIMHGMESEKIILIGDHHQLRPTITCEDAEKLGLSVSLFERLVALKATPNFLDTQYRMHPKLAAYLSWMFYDSKLKNGVNCAQRQPTKNYPWNNRLHPIEFRAVWGEESTRGCSKFNELEANEVKKVVDKLLRAGVGPNQVGVITPYEAQRILLTKILEKYKVEIKNVDGFQGREKDYIIFSCVRSAKQSSIGFVRNPNRLNVAITRAKLGLIMVGNSFILSRKKLWNQMLYQYLDDDAIVNVSRMKDLFEQPQKQKPKEIFATKLHEENQLVKNVQQTRPNKILKITNLPRFRNRFDTPKFVRFEERLLKKLTEYGELEETKIMRSGVVSFFIFIIYNVFFLKRMKSQILKN